MTQHPGMFTQCRFTELGTEKESEELGYEIKKKKEEEREKERGKKGDYKYGHHWFAR